eukprot:gene8758-9693_t
MDPKTADNKESYDDEMIEIEYMLATMGNTTSNNNSNKINQTKAIPSTSLSPDNDKSGHRIKTVSESETDEQRRQAERRRVASLVVAMGIEAELPVEFYEKLAKSRRVTVLLRSVVSDQQVCSLIRELYK